MAVEAVYVVDSREQRPYRLEPSVVGALATGDYSVAGLEELVVVERKSLEDFVACCGRERSRFLRELERLRGYPHAAVVIEASWESLGEKTWRGTVSPETLKSSVCSWAARFCPLILAGSRRGGRSATKRFLDAVVRLRLRELDALTNPKKRPRRRRTKAPLPQRTTTIEW